MGNHRRFAKLYESRVREERVARFLAYWGSLLLWCAIPLTLLVALDWLSVWNLGRGAGLIWVVTLGMTGLYAWWQLRGDVKLRQRVAQGMESGSGDHGLVLAAAHLMDAQPRLGQISSSESAPEYQSRFAPLVLARANDFAKELTASKALSAVVFASRPWPTLMGLLVVCLLMQLIPGPATPFGLKPDGEEASTEAFDSSAAPGDPKAASLTTPAKDDAAAALPDFTEVAQLDINPSHQVYLLNEPVHVRFTMKQLGVVSEDVPVEVVLGLSDATLSPDRGFGIGVRPIPMRLNWALSKSGPGTQTKLVEITDYLKALQMIKPGLITLEAWVKPVNEKIVVGGDAAPRKIIQFALNRERQKVNKPSPVEQVKVPEKPKKEKKPPPKKRQSSQKGGKKPALAKKDRLKKAERQAKAIKPLLADGKTVKKEVNVFDRERGGQEPLPDALKKMKLPEREYAKREERVIQKPHLTPEQSRKLKRYWDALRKGP